MAYQFGTRRLATNPLKELLKEQDARRAKEENRATQTLRQFPFRDVYQGADGNYYENRTDNQGNYYPESQISKAQFDAYTQQNAINNRARTELGLNPVETSPAPTPEVDTGGFMQTMANFGRNFASKFGKNKETVASTPPTGKLQTIDDGQKTAQKNQIANPNITGTNVGVDKPVGGGALKSQITDDKLSKPVIDPNNPTEIAYQKSLETKKPQTFAGTPETEKAYQQSFSQKGKPPPNMTKDELAKIGTKGAEAWLRDNRRDKNLKRIQGQVAKKKSMTPIEAYEVAMDKGNKNSAPRLTLPSMAGANQDAQTQLANARKEAMDKSFVASAKADNKKAQEAMQKYQESIRPPSPNTASVVYNNRDKTTISPDFRNRVSVPSIAEADIFRNPENVQQAVAKAKKGNKSIVKKSAVKGARDKVLSQFAKDIKTQLSKIETGTLTPRDYKKFGSFK